MKWKIASFSTLAVSIVVAAVQYSTPANAVAQQVPGQTAVLQLIRTAQAQMQRGDLAGAELSFQKATALAPTFADSYLGLGLVQLKAGRPDEAERSLIRSTELNPRIPGVHLFLAIAQHHTGNNDRALESLNSELALNPQNAEALMWMGIVEMESGHPEKATGPLDQASSLKPSDENILYYSGRAHTLMAEASFRRLRELDPDSALVHRALAENFSESKEPERAIGEYEAALRKDPANPDLYEVLGEENLRIGRTEAAVKAFGQALEFNPGSSVALYNLGRIDVEKGKPEEGIALLRKAEAAHALAAPTDFYLGLGLVHVGQDAEAAKWLEHSLVSNPSPFIEQSADFQLARIYQKLGKKLEAQQALARLKALKQNAAKSITQSDSPGVVPATLEPKPY